LGGQPTLNGFEVGDCLIDARQHVETICAASFDGNATLVVLPLQLVGDSRNSWLGETVKTKKDRGISDRRGRAPNTRDWKRFPSVVVRQQYVVGAARRPADRTPAPPTLSEGYVRCSDLVLHADVAPQEPIFERHPKYLAEIACLRVDARWKPRSGVRG